MARTVTLVAEIIAEKCTGCDLCVRVCPTLALSMRDRLPSELGKGKRMVEVDPTACYNVQNCVEICPHEAIVMRELDEPFTASTDVSHVDQAAIAAMAARAGFAVDSMICVCTETTTAEICAAKDMFPSASKYTSSPNPSGAAPVASIFTAEPRVRSRPA